MDGPDKINQQLCEFSQLGMRAAAETFSRLLGQPVAIEVERAWSSGQGNEISLPPVAGIGIFTEIHGDISGGLLLFLGEECAGWLAEKLLQGHHSGPLLEEPASSTLKEIGNIISSAFLSSLDNQLKLNALPKPPVLDRGTLSALVESYQNGAHDASLVIHTHLSSGNRGLAEFQGETYLFLSCQTMEQLVLKIASRRNTTPQE